MNHLTKLGIGVVLGILAGILNAVYLFKSQPKTDAFVALSAELPLGEAISQEKLTELHIPDGLGMIADLLVPWSDRHLLLQLPASRNYRTGEAVLKRDVDKMLALASRQTELLRFRVIAVGDRFKRQSEPDSDTNIGSGGNTVTIAVKQPQMAGSSDNPTGIDERNARRMIQVVTRQMAEKESLAEDRILGVAVFPREDQSAENGTTSAPVLVENTRLPIEHPRADEMAITISLDGVESVPAVILVGGEIGFFMYPEFPG